MQDDKDLEQPLIIKEGRPRRDSLTMFAHAREQSTIVWDKTVALGEKYFAIKLDDNKKEEKGERKTRAEIQNEEWRACSLALCSPILCGTATIVNVLGGAACCCYGLSLDMREGMSNYKDDICPSREIMDDAEEQDNFGDYKPPDLSMR